MHTTTFSKAIFAVAAIAGSAIVSQAPIANAATLFGPSPYTKASDSPFSGIDFSNGYFNLENFEDGALNTPGAAASAGFVLGGLPNNSLTDSVDGDDGVVDGSGSAGNSFYSAGARTLRFTFDASVLGNLPTYVGIVWTDVGFTDGDVPPVFTGVGNVTFRAFGSANQLLAEITGSDLGDGQANGGTAEDRFFGVKSALGISYFEISMPNSDDWEVDHLQYGYQPIPTPALLPGLIGMGVAALRKRQTDEEQAS